MRSATRRPPHTGFPSLRNGEHRHTQASAKLHLRMDFFPRHTDTDTCMHTSTSQHASSQHASIESRMRREEVRRSGRGRETQCWLCPDTVQDPTHKRDKEEGSLSRREHAKCRKRFVTLQRGISGAECMPIKRSRERETHTHTTPCTPGTRTQSGAHSGRKTYSCGKRSRPTRSLSTGPTQSHTRTQTHTHTHTHTHTQ